jgi:hypothetical protein
VGEFKCNVARASLVEPGLAFQTKKGGACSKKCCTTPKRDARQVGMWWHGVQGQVGTGCEIGTLPFLLPVKGD